MAERTYSTIIRPCGDETSDPRREPGEYRWELDTEVSEGVATIHKTFFFTLNDLADSTSFWGGNVPTARQICPAEVLKSRGFPITGDELAEATGYYYTGNGTLRHLADDSRIWAFTAEYKPRRYNFELHKEKRTAPWNRKPTNVSIEFVEREEPFTVGYRNRAWYKKTYPRPNSGVVYYDPSESCLVHNSAGDPINARTTRSRTQIRFTYNLKPSDFDINDIIDCKDSVNKEQMWVIGLHLKAGQARLVDIKPEYMTEIPEGGDEKDAWKYWQITAVIEASTRNDTFNQKLLNVGGRAIWRRGGRLQEADGKYFLGTGEPWYKARIVQWNSWTKKYGQADGEPQLGPIGMAMKAKVYYDAQRIGHETVWPAFSYEVLDDAPLWYDGTVYTYAMMPKRPEFGKYLTVEFPEHPWVDWDQCNFPKKGVQW